MAGNIVSFDKEKLIEGIDILYHATAPTLGPRAYTAALDEGFRRRIIDDGVIIATRVILQDKIQNFGANTLAEAARKTADEAGDGTTATIILAHAIIHEALKAIGNGVHPMSLRKGLEDALQLLHKRVDAIKTPITDLKQIIQIATVSCKDEKLGKLIAETINQMTQDGIVTVEESKATETYVDFQKGMRFESGYAHLAFVTHPENMEAIYTNPKILILDKTISFEGLLPIFKLIQEKGQSIVIIAPSMDARMGEFLIENKRKGALQSLYINAPYAANFQKDFLQDLAILTGARYIPLTEGAHVEDIILADLGEAEKIISSKNSTIILSGKGDQDAVSERIKAIKSLVKSTPSDFETDKYRERLAKLTTGVAVIKIGGQTEVEMNERRERAIDAVAATKAALEDGIVIGGEMAYLQLTQGLNNTMAEKILSIALTKPFEQLLTNAGLNPGTYQEKLKHTNIHNAGIDVTTGETVDMVKSGIIDPAKVIKCAIANSISVTIQLLTVNCIIVPQDETKMSGVSQK